MSRKIIGLPWEIPKVSLTRCGSTGARNDGRTGYPVTRV
jgi:hypothetical protein